MICSFLKSIHGLIISLDKKLLFLKEVGVVVSNGNMQTNICYQWKYFLQVIYILSLMTMDKQMHRL
jgi:hypothetical protein